MKINSLLAGLALSASVCTAYAQDNTVTVQTKKIGAEIQPTMYGIFFEDINFGADGGLYAELVKNRSFVVRSTRTRTTCAWPAQGTATCGPASRTKASSASA